MTLQMSGRHELCIEYRGRLIQNDLKNHIRSKVIITA